MNNRWRQKNKVLRMYMRSAKKSNELLIPSEFIYDIANALREVGDAAVKCANTLSELLICGSVQTLLKAVARYNGEVEG